MFEELLISPSEFRWKRRHNRYVNKSRNYYITKQYVSGKVYWQVQLEFRSKISDEHNHVKINNLAERLEYKKFSTLANANQFMIENIQTLCSTKQVENFDGKLQPDQDHSGNYLILYNQHYPLSKKLPFTTRRPLFFVQHPGTKEWFICHDIVEDIENKTGEKIQTVFKTKTQLLEYLHNILTSHLLHFHQKYQYEEIKSFLLHGKKGYLIDGAMLNKNWWILFTKPEIDLNHIFASK